MLDIALIAHDQPATIVHPCEAARYLPAMAAIRAGAYRPPALGPAPAALNDGDGRLAPAPPQLLAQALAVVPSVGHQFPGPCPRATTPLGHTARRQGGPGQRAFMRAGTRHMQPDRRPLAIGHHHHLRALADFGLADAGAPFFAGTKLPSRNAWAHSSLLCASRRLRSARQIRSQTPSADH